MGQGGKDFWSAAEAEVTVVVCGQRDRDRERPPPDVTYGSVSGDGQHKIHYGQQKEEKEGRLRRPIGCRGSQ